MINTIQEILKSNKNIYAWNVKEVIKDSYQLFLIRKTLDMNREALVKEYFVNIYTKYESKGVCKIGTAKF